MYKKNVYNNNVVKNKYGFSMVETTISLGLFALVVVGMINSENLLKKMSGQSDKETNYITFKSSMYSIVSNQRLCEDNLTSFTTQLPGTKVAFDQEFIVDGEVLIDTNQKILNEKYNDFTVSSFNLHYINTNEIEFQLDLKMAGQKKLKKVRAIANIYYKADGSIKCETNQQRTIEARCNSGLGSYNKMTNVCNLFKMGGGSKSEQQCLGIAGEVLVDSPTDVIYCSRGTSYFKDSNIIVDSTTNDTTLDITKEIEISESDKDDYIVGSSFIEKKELWSKELVTYAYSKVGGNLNTVITKSRQTKELVSDPYSTAVLTVDTTTRLYEDKDIFLKATEAMTVLTKETSYNYLVKKLEPISGKPGVLLYTETTKKDIEKEINTSRKGYY